MSGDKEQEYFSDGLAEEIINALAQVSGLKVIARTSAFAFKGQEHRHPQDRRDAGRGERSRRQRAALRQSHPRDRAVDHRRRRLAICGRSATTARWRTSSQCRMKSPPPSPVRSKSSCRRPPRSHVTHPSSRHRSLLKAKHFHWKVTAESMEQAKDILRAGHPTRSAVCLGSTAWTFAFWTT